MLSNKPLKLLHDEERSSHPQSEAEKFQQVNQQNFAELLTFLEFTEAFNLTIGFVEINYVKDTDYLIESLQNHPSCEDVRFLICNFDDPQLRFLRDELINSLSKVTVDNNKKLVIIIRGLENSIGSSGDYPPILQDLNYIRDAFPESVPHPILFCLPDYAITRLALFAPDFWSWRSGLFQFITFEDFRSTQEWIMPKTRQFYLTIQSLDSSVSKERIELLKELLQDHSVKNRETKQNLHNYLTILTQLGIACRSNYNTLVESKEYLKQAYELVNSADSSISIIVRGNVIYELGVTYLKLGNLVSALSYLQKSLELRKNIGDFKGTAETLDKIGIIYTQQGKFEAGLNYFDYCLTIQESIKNDLGKAEALNQIGIVRIEKGEIERAIALYQQVLLVYTRETFPKPWATFHNNLGNGYCNYNDGDVSENLEKAIASYENALQVYTPEEFPQQWGKIQNNLAVAYSNRIRGDKDKNLKKAIAHYQHALEVYTSERIDR